MADRTITVNGRSVLVFEVVRRRGDRNRKVEFLFDQEDYEVMLEVIESVSLWHGHNLKWHVLYDIINMVDRDTLTKYHDETTPFHDDHDDGRVRSLYLPKTQSRVPATIAPNLPKVEFLCLHHIVTLEGLASFVGNLPNLARLEIVDGQRRFDFRSFPEDVGNLVQLRTLSVSAKFDTDDPIPPSLWKLIHLKTLQLSLKGTTDFCVPDGIGELKRLERLDFSDASIRSLPSTVRNLTNLKSLNLSNTEKLTSLPEQVGELVNLQELDMGRSGISSLSSEMIQKLTNLKKLVIRSKHLRNLLIDAIGTLPCIEEFTIGDDSKLTKLPDWIGNFRHMKELNLHRITNVDSLPKEICNLTNLESLLVRKTGIACLPPSIGRLPNLKKLRLIGNRNLTSLSEGVYELSKLEELTVSHSPGWKHAAPKAIQQLLERCSSLVHLDVTMCEIYQIDAVRVFPKHLFRLTLDANPILRFVKAQAKPKVLDLSKAPPKVLDPRGKNLFDLVRQSKVQYLVSSNGIERKLCEELRYELFVNRARYRILNEFFREGRVVIPPALWAMLLAHAPVVFCHTDGTRDPFTTLGKEDAIYALVKLLICTDSDVVGGVQKR